MLRADKALRKALRCVLKENGAEDAEGYLLSQPGGSALAAVPAHSRHVRVNTLKLSTDEAARRLASYVPRRDPHISDLLATSSSMSASGNSASTPSSAVSGATRRC